MGGLDSQYENFVWLGGDKWVVGYGSTTGAPSFVCLDMIRCGRDDGLAGGVPVVRTIGAAGTAAGVLALPRLGAGGTINGFCMISRNNSAIRPCYDLNAALSVRPRRRWCFRGSIPGTTRSPTPKCC